MVIYLIMMYLIQIDKILLNDYVNQHKERYKLLYNKINLDLIQKRDQIITKMNENRDKPNLFQPEKKVFVKTNIRQKNANKF